MRLMDLHLKGHCSCVPVKCFNASHLLFYLVTNLITTFVFAAKVPGCDSFMSERMSNATHL